MSTVLAMDPLSGPKWKAKSLRFGILLGLFVLLYIAGVIVFIIIY
jgi:hypothetical protein